MLRRFQQTVHRKRLSNAITSVPAAVGMPNKTGALCHDSYTRHHDGFDVARHVINSIASTAHLDHRYSDTCTNLRDIRFRVRGSGFRTCR